MKDTEIGKACKSYNRTECAATIANKIIDVGVGAISSSISMITEGFPQLGIHLEGALTGAASEAIKQGVDSAFVACQTAKRMKLLDKIVSYNGVLTNDDIESIELLNFMIEYRNTLEVVDRVTNDKKVNYIANLFGKSFIEQKGINSDQFDEFLNHLATLSTREIEILVEMYKLEKTHKAPEGDKTPLINSACHEQITKIAKTRWEIGEDELIGMMTSLCRTGFLKEVTGAICGYQGGRFNTTAYFEKFLTYILDTEDLDDIGDIDTFNDGI